MNTMDKAKKRAGMKFLFACYFVYLISITIKMLFSAEMAEIIVDLGSTKADVSLGLTFYYISYAVGQLILSKYMKKIPMRYFMAVSIALTALSFGSIWFCKTLTPLYIILFLNGFFQTGVWGGIIHYVSKYLPKEMAAFASGFLTTAFAAGTALSYGASAVCILLFDWRFAFVVFAVLSLVSVAVFLPAVQAVKTRFGVQQASTDEQAALPGRASSKRERVYTTVLLSVTIVVLSGMYYAFTGWFPNLLIETFGMKTEYSLLLSLFLTATMAPSSFFLIRICERSHNSYYVCLLFSAVTFGLLVLLCALFRVHMVLTLALSVVMLFCARGVINAVSAYLPLKLKDTMDPGVLSLIINAFAAVAAAIMPYTMALVVDNVGWDAFFGILVLMSAILMLLFAYAGWHERRGSANLHKHPLDDRW